MDSKYNIIIFTVNKKYILKWLIFIKSIVIFNKWLMYNTRKKKKYDIRSYFGIFPNYSLLNINFMCPHGIKSQLPLLEVSYLVVSVKYF